MTAFMTSAIRQDYLPAELQRAQDAMKLPEVEEMLRKLSKYNLGIYMPHIHDEKTGEFLPLPAGVTQVEDDLVVTFVDSFEAAGKDGETYIEVGWFVHPDTPNEISVTGSCRAYCRMVNNLHTKGHTHDPD